MYWIIDELKPDSNSTWVSKSKHETDPNSNKPDPKFTFG